MRRTELASVSASSAKRRMNRCCSRVRSSVSRILRSARGGLPDSPLLSLPRRDASGGRTSRPLSPRPVNPPHPPSARRAETAKSADAFVQRRRLVATVDRLSRPRSAASNARRDAPF